MKPLKLAYNRVWRTYTCGKAIDGFYGIEPPEDGHYPEVWIASTTMAINPDLKENEGLSLVKGEELYLKDLIERNPVAYLGSIHSEVFGADTGVLVKLLDAAERLTIQVHPDNDTAMELFGSRFGKTEAWYVIPGREIDGDAPHIYLGFKEGIRRDEWVRCFREQDIEGMLKRMHKIYVEPGDVYLIEGGTPHAIGAGCCIVEIQEPTDLTIRIEKVTPGGYRIPDRICHQGLGFDKMFDCFHFDGYTEQEVRQRWQVAKSGRERTEINELIGYEHTPCFGLVSMTLTDSKKLEPSEAFSVLFVLDGKGIIECDGQSVTVEKGDQVFIPAKCDMTVNPTSLYLRLLQCLPPRPQGKVMR